MPKVPSLPHRPRQSIDSQAVDMWTTLKKRSPHAHSHNKCKCQARSDIDQEAAVRFTSIRHITHIPRAQPTDSPEEADSLISDLAGVLCMPKQRTPARSLIKLSASSGESVGCARGM